MQLSRHSQKTSDAINAWQILDAGNFRNTDTYIYISTTKKLLHAYVHHVYIGDHSSWWGQESLAAVREGPKEKCS